MTNSTIISQLGSIGTGCSNIITWLSTNVPAYIWVILTIFLALYLVIDAFIVHRVGESVTSGVSQGLIWVIAVCVIIVLILFFMFA